MENRVQELRKKAGFKSARSFAEHIGMNVHTYTSYEQCSRDMTLEAAWNIADGLGCSLDDMVGREFTSAKPRIELTDEQVRYILMALDGE